MDQIIKLADENGVEKDFQFLFAVNHEITKEQYNFFVEMNTNSPEIVAYKSDAQGQLYDIESQEDWQFASDIFNAYLSQMRGGCGGCHGGCGDGCDCDGDCEGGCEH